MGRESRATWARRIRRWTQSGLTAEPFAPWESVNPRTLSFWRWKLRHAAPGGRGPAPAPAGAADEPVNAVSLLEVGASRRARARQAGSRARSPREPAHALESQLVPVPNPSRRSGLHLDDHGVRKSDAHREYRGAVGGGRVRGSEAH